MILVLAMLACGVLSTVGFVKDCSHRYHFELLCYMFFGSMLMWSVDLAAAVAEEGFEAFKPGIDELIDDIKLSLCVIAAAVVFWAFCLKLTALRSADPAGV